MQRFFIFSRRNSDPISTSGDHGEQDNDEIPIERVHNQSGVSGNPTNILTGRLQTEHDKKQGDTRLPDDLIFKPDTTDIFAVPHRLTSLTPTITGLNTTSLTNTMKNKIMKWIKRTMNLALILTYHFLTKLSIIQASTQT